MKTGKIIKILSILFLFLILGCGTDYKVKTIINSDGSCQRSISAALENPMKEDFYKMNLPIPIDTTWNLVIEEDTNENGDTIYMHTATKIFKNVDQLNQMYMEDSTDFACLERAVKLKKKFRWFYTFFNYEETVNKLFNQPSLNNYLDSLHYNYAMLNDSAQEIYLKENFDTTEAKRFDKEAEEGLEKWIEKTILLSSFDAIEKSAKNIDGWPISESDFFSIKDSIIESMDQHIDLFDKDDGVFGAIKRVFNIDSLLYEKLKNEDSFHKYIEKYKFWEDRFTSEGYINSVAMPGLILETNCSNIKEPKEVQWRVGWINYFTDDYRMFVQSRIVNAWAFWVSGAFAALLIISVLLRRFVRMKK